MSRRDNGLPGADWHRLTDLEPPVADLVIDALAEHGIAAYAETAEPRGDSYFGTRPPTRAVDGVFVPLDALDRARAVLDTVLPQLGTATGGPAAGPRAGSGTGTGASEDEVWAGIVAAYAGPAAEHGPEGLAADSGTGTDSGSDVDPEAALDPGEGTSDRPTSAPSAAGPTGFEDIRAELDAAARAREHPAGPSAGDEHDGWEPPPPPPLPTADGVTRLAWTGFVGGPLFLLLSTVLGWGPGGTSALLAVLATVGGFVTLVARMRDEPRDPGDDGAVV